MKLISFTKQRKNEEFDFHNENNVQANQTYTKDITEQETVKS